jgi:thiamine biosynthesis lipoprotein
MNDFKFKKNLFGKEIEVQIYDFYYENPHDLIKEFYEEALRLQKIFNFFDEKSELSRLNKKHKMKVSKELMHVLKKSLKFSEITSGKYNPTIGKDIALRKRGKKVSGNKPNYKDIKINFKKVEFRDKEINLDLGSIAKGYITDKLGDFLKSKGIKEFIINSRGDLLFCGKNEHVIGIQNPRDFDKELLKIKVKDCGVATSGDYKQFKKDYSNSHILNQKDIISVTVVAPKLEDADVLATAIFVSDENKIEKIMENKPKAKALVINKKLNQKTFNSFEELIY